MFSSKSKNFGCCLLAGRYGRRDSVIDFHWSVDRLRPPNGDQVEKVDPSARLELLQACGGPLPDRSSAVLKGQAFEVLCHARFSLRTGHLVPPLL